MSAPADEAGVLPPPGPEPGPGAIELGLFLPVANNGWALSTTAPPDPPTFELNAHLARRAEEMGLHFLLGQSVWRGHGGVSRFWDVTLETCTLMAALARETTTLGLVATVPPPLYPAPVAAKMLATLDEVSGGRAGVNVVAGASQVEYGQMGLVPPDYTSLRYEYAEEWVRTVKQLWSDGRAGLTLRGRWTALDDCRSEPGPRQGEDFPVICAGASPRGMRFAAEWGTHAFIAASTPDGLSALIDRYREAADVAGRPLRLYTAVNYLLLADDRAATRAEAAIRAGADEVAIADLLGRYAAPGAGASQRDLLVDSGEHVFFGGIHAGGPGRIAEHLASLAALGFDGVLLTFTYWDAGLDLLQSEVLPALGPLVAGPDRAWGARAPRARPAPSLR
jgi:pyrimidine oxygenase